MMGDRRVEGRVTLRHGGKIVVLVFAVLLFGYGLISCSGEDEKAVESGSDSSAESTDRPISAEDSEAARIIALTNALEGSEELARFSHDNEYHQQVTCLACHLREDNSGRMKFPGKNAHTPCIGCHTKQFEDKQNLMCTICHTETETGKMKRFPKLRSFNASFDHALHLSRSNCVDCHRPRNRGAAKSIPVGSAAHATCFQCHSSNSALELSSCGVCHQSGPPPAAVKRSGRAIRVNFKHSNHRMSCSSCHTVLKKAGRGRQVTEPLAAMHFAPKNRTSCATCHNNKRAFGGDDFSDCKRCHTGKSFGF